MKKETNNRQIQKDIRNLRQEKEAFIKKSLSADQIKRRAGTAVCKDILVHVRAIKKYGVKRYLLEDIKIYTGRSANGRKIFVELIGGQTGFLQPIGKNRQSKLCFKI